MKAKREPSFWIFSATGVVMLLAMGIFIWSIVASRREGARVTASESPRAGGGVAVGTYEVLSRVYPPAYRDLSGSRTERPPQLRTAIQQYSQRDYEAAMTSFAAAVNRQPDLVEARLYLGVCYLYAGKRPEAIAELRKVVAAGGTPYLEQGRFYLAKGLIGSGDIAGARQQLDEAIAMHGDLEQQAETLRARIK